MKKLVLFIIVTLFIPSQLFSQDFEDSSSEWRFQGVIPPDTSVSSTHGLAFDANGNIWTSPYYSSEVNDIGTLNSIYCFTPDGQPCEFINRIYNVETGDTLLYLGPTTGMTSDENGDILVSVHGYRRSYDNFSWNSGHAYILRIDHNTGELLNIAEVTHMRSETAAHSIHIDADKHGNIYYSTVFPNQPIRVIDRDFLHIMNIAEPRSGFSRSITVNAEGTRVFQPYQLTTNIGAENIHEAGIWVYAGDIDNGYQLVDTTTFAGMDSGAGAICPQSEVMYLPASGIHSFLRGDTQKWDPYMIYGFYEPEESKDFFLVDSLKWHNIVDVTTNDSIPPAYRGLTITPDGLSIAVGNFNDNGAGVQLFSRESLLDSESMIPYPEQVQILSHLNNSIFPDNSVEVSWNPSEPKVQVYHVELGLDELFSEVIFDTSINETSFIFQGLNNQQQYWWRVKGENVVGEGPYSELSSFYVTNNYVSTNGEIVSGVSKFTDDIFFTSSKDDRVYSFDKTGHVLWIVETGGALQSTIAVDASGHTYVGSNDTRLYSFDEHGIPRWDRALGGTILSSPSIGDENLVFVGISTGRFFAVSKEDGNIEWSIQTGNAIVSSASVDSDGNVFFGSNDGKLYSVNHSGELQWTYETGGAVTGSPALTLDGEIVFPSQDGKVYKLDRSGDLLWDFQSEGAISSSPVIRADGAVIFGSGDGIIYAVSEDGNLLWSYDVGSPANGSPALTIDGLLVIGSDDGMISVFNQDGELLRQYRTGGSILAPVLVNEDNSIHVSSTDGYVYILENVLPVNFSKQSTGLEEPIHPWATFKGNNRRTGNQADIIEVSVEDYFDSEDFPTAFELQQNYPNPFNPSTQIRFAVPEQSHIRLSIYNMLGQHVSTLVNDTRSPGWHDVTFDASGLSSGLYIYRLEAGGFAETHQMMFVK